MNEIISYARVMACLIREERRNRGSKVAAYLATYVGMSASGYNKIEMGDSELGLSEAVAFIRALGFDITKAFAAVELACHRIQASGKEIYGFTPVARGGKKSELMSLNSILSLMQEDEILRPLFFLAPMRIHDLKHGYGFLGILIEYIERGEACLQEGRDIERRMATG